MDPSPGTDGAAPKVVGRYELVTRLAEGALGELWRARIVSGAEEGRVVLLRRIRRTPAVGTEAVERITNAGFAAMELRHPRIAAVLDVVVAETEILVVSEHIDGGVLTSLLRPAEGKRSPVAPGVALRIAVDVLEALDGVGAPWSEIVGEPGTDDERALLAGVHGGIVPDDLFVPSFGETMLLETGIAGIALNVPALLEQTDVLAFRAPEQLERKGPIDGRTDIFSVGVLTWELIAGRSLFGPTLLPRPGAAAGPKPPSASDAAQAAGTRRRVLTGPIQRLDAIAQLKGAVKKELADCVARCLERDPARRYPSIREAIDAFKALGAGAIAGHEAVAACLAPEVADAAAPASSTPAPGSTRPTLAPEEDPNRPTTPPEGGRPGEHDAEGVTQTGSPAGAAPLPETLPPESLDADGILAAASASGASRPGAAATDVEAAPISLEPEPISLEPESPGAAPPPASAPSAEPLSVEPEPGSVTKPLPGAIDVPPPPPSVMTLSDAPPAPAPPAAEPPAAPFDVAAGAFPVAARPWEASDAAREDTSVPVVRPLDEPVLADAPGASVAPGADSRRAAGRKVVIGAIAAAVLIAIIAALRSGTSSGPAEGQSAASDHAPPRAGASAVAPPPAPPKDETPAAPAAEASAAAEAEPEAAPEQAAEPSGAPGSVAPAAPSDPSRKQPAGSGPRKKPFRPTDI